MQTQAAPPLTLSATAPLVPIVLDGHRLRVGDLVLDLGMRTVHGRNGNAIALSSNEFAILATLMKSTGRFVSKDELLASVMGAQSHAEACVVDSYVKYLRDRFQEAKSSATIEKATGFGFRLRP